MNEAVIRQKPCEACGGPHYSERREMGLSGKGLVPVISAPCVPAGMAYFLNPNEILMEPLPEDVWSADPAGGDE